MKALTVTRFLVAAFALLLACCVNSSNGKQGAAGNQPEIIVKKEYYKDGSVKGEFTHKVIDGDTVLDGTSTLFFQSGEVMMITNFSEGKQHGSSSNFYESGNLEYEGRFEHGKKQGFWRAYYNSSRQLIEYKLYFDNGVQTSHQYWYYRNGSINAYAFCAPDGESVFACEYDSTGNVLLEHGHKQPIFKVITENSDYSKYSLGDTIKINVLSIAPPHHDCDITIENDELPMYKSLSEQMIRCEIVANKSGQFFLDATLFIEDLNEVYTNRFEFEVINPGGAPVSS